MKFILAEKKEMTQQFMEDGTVIPVTRVVAGPCVVTQSKSADKDGYTAVQIAFGKNLCKIFLVCSHFFSTGIFACSCQFRIN